MSEKITRTEAAKLLGISPYRLDYQIKAKNIKRFKWLGEINFLKSDIEKLNQMEEIK